MRRCCWMPFILWSLLSGVSSARPNQRMIIIGQDCMGPGGTDLDAVLMFIQSPQVERLGITVVSGDGWRDEEVAHTLRMLEIIGRTDIPVFPGAVFPLVNSKNRAEDWERRYGKNILHGRVVHACPGLEIPRPIRDSGA